MGSTGTVERSHGTDARVLRLAMQLARQYAAQYDAYLRDCESDRQRGYRPHHCEHGTNLWVDYDNICGGCEDGNTMADGMHRRTVALGEAKARIAKSDALTALVRQARDLGVLDAIDYDVIFTEKCSLLMVGGN